MKFLRIPAVNSGKLGVLPGTFNPVTNAHLALAEAALRVLDHIVLVLPRQFPHKGYSGASLDQRLEMLAQVAANHRQLSVATSEGGLYLEIARECRAALGDALDVVFVCGRDAAERIATWDYGSPGAAEAMRREFRLLVAARGGPYQPPLDWQSSIDVLPLDPCFEDVSATEIRRRAAVGEPWQHLAPAAIHPLIRQIYGTSRPLLQSR
ncbi:MAG: adenylyltransferase/cytidyltransferase family protein [Bryobacteraceae bacterium]|jgi:nicotinate (nicotinamide) nucleotide adenylyltransferase